MRRRENVKRNGGERTMGRMRKTAERMRGRKNEKGRMGEEEKMRRRERGERDGVGKKRKEREKKLPKKNTNAAFKNARPKNDNVGRKLLLSDPSIHFPATALRLPACLRMRRRE